MKRARIAVDGASKGNPGPAGIGVAISDESGKTLREISEYIGTATNNVAEYTALVRALTEAIEMGFTHVSIITDSELMARQINGQYRVKNEGILPLYDRVRDLMALFKSASVSHVTRDKNKQADQLASKAASAKADIVQPVLIEDDAAPPPPSAKSPLPKPAAEEGSMLKRISIRTASRSQFMDITSQVKDAVKASGVADGICTIYVPHTTAGVTINENADPDVTRDMIDTLDRLVPRSASYRHVEGNSDAHIKASLMGFSTSVLIEGGRLSLGTWQGIYFCEFDGPRNRQFLVKILPG